MQNIIKVSNTYLVGEGRVSWGYADDRDVVEATGVGDGSWGQVSGEGVRHYHSVHLAHTRMSQPPTLLYTSGEPTDFTFHIEKRLKLWRTAVEKLERNKPFRGWRASVKYRPMK